MRVRNDSIYQFASPYFDAQQGEFAWGIIDLPEPRLRDDDQYYEIRSVDDRLDLIAHKYLGDVRWLYVIMHYNNIPDALNLTDFLGKRIRIPSKKTIERFYFNAIE